MFDRLNQRFSNWALEQTIKLLDRLAELRHDNEGAETMEYVLVGGMIAALLIGAIWRYGNRLLQLWNRMTNSLR